MVVITHGVWDLLPPALRGEHIRLAHRKLWLVGGQLLQDRPCIVAARSHRQAPYLRGIFFLCNLWLFLDWNLALEQMFISCRSNNMLS